jgi:hypothetical protein
MSTIGVAAQRLASGVSVLPLVPDAVLPIAAPGSTRPRVPAGYGVQEHCLPFVAATALGLLVRSPISFGLCAPSEVPRAAHAFAPPLEADRSAGGGRLFYVQDDPACAFSGNAFTFSALQGFNKTHGSPVVPGLSFFERSDQLELFKLHLPFIIRTDTAVDTLFLPPINRRPPFDVVVGLVETDWYAHPVNLVLRRPAAGSVHVAKGDPVAQLVLVDRDRRNPEVKVLPHHARVTRDVSTQYAEWLRRHAADRSAYKQIARSRAAVSQSPGRE